MGIHVQFGFIYDFIVSKFLFYRELSDTTHSVPEMVFFFGGNHDERCGIPEIIPCHCLNSGHTSYAREYGGEEICILE